MAADYTRTHGRKAGEVMTRDVVTVADTTPIAEIAQLLETRRIKRVPVTARRQAGRHRQPAQRAAGAGQQAVGRRP